MLGRSRRRATLSHLPILGLAAACYHVPVRPALVSPARSMSNMQQTAGGDVPSPVAPRLTLTLLAESGAIVVDAADDSATAHALRPFLARRAAELTVEVAGAGSYLRLSPASRSGEYDRLFVVDGVPVANGFRLAIKTSKLERIEVLDDALSKGPYGPRAAAGVILISTRGR